MGFPNIHFNKPQYSKRRECCFRGGDSRHRPLDAVGQIDDDDDVVVVIHVRGQGRRDGPVIFYFLRKKNENKKRR